MTRPDLTTVVVLKRYKERQLRELYRQYHQEISQQKEQENDGDWDYVFAENIRESSLLYKIHGLVEEIYRMEQYIVNY